MHTAPASAQAMVVDCLRLEARLAEALEAVLQAQGASLRRFARAEEWIAALQQALPRALLVPAAAAGNAVELLDKLTGGDARIGGVPLLASGSAGQRLDALFGGADGWFDSAEPARFAAELAAWVMQQDPVPFRVLLVEDDRDGRAYAAGLLRRVGMQVEEVADPATALARAEALRPDIVLLDLHMPGLDGVALTAQLRASSSLSPHLPIIMLSGEERPGARYSALRLGADDFLVKPVPPRALIASVRARAKRARAQQRNGVVAAERGPRLRRSEFFAELARRAGHEGASWCVLLALRVDQGDLQERLGLSDAYALERALDARLRPLLAPGDRYSLWEEFGFGLLVERASAEAIEQLLAALLAAVAATPFVVDDANLPLSVSIGYALPPRERRDDVADRWIGSAFAALAMATRLGGGRAEGVLSRDPGALPPERVMVITQALKDLDRGGSLRFAFQPLLGLHDERRQFALLARLRDLRSPLQGYPRHEYLALARKHGKLALIDRLSLFHAFETVAELQQHGHVARLLVPLDLAATDERQSAWLEAELRRRSGLAAALLLELDAEALQDPAHAPLLARLQAAGVALAAATATPDLGLFERLAAQPVQLLRLPHALLAGAATTALAPLLERWHASGRQLLVDRVESLQAVSGLWSLGVDFLQGDVLAGASPRPDLDAPDAE
jgi:CheY-like chemotaxis protein